MVPHLRGTRDHFLLNYCETGSHTCARRGLSPATVPADLLPDGSRLGPGVLPGSPAMVGEA